MLEMLKQLIVRYDYLVDRYECFVAQGKNREACFEIRRQIFGDELKRWSKKKAAGPAEEDSLDAHSIQIGCRDTKTGKIVGCVRITPANYISASPEYHHEYHLLHFPAGMLPLIYVASRLVVLPEYRKTPVSLLLSCKAYEVGFTSCVVCISICEPNLYPMYRRLGYRPLDHVFTSHFGGYRLPLFLIVHDYDYLKWRESPFLRVGKKMKFPHFKEGMEWFQKTSKVREFIVPGFTLIPEGESNQFHSFLTKGLSRMGKAQLLRNAVSVYCQYGDKVIAAGQGEKNIGFVRRGALQIKSRNQVIAVLGEGDVFGEIAFILNVPRTADVVAATSDTEVVLLSLSAVKRLKNPADQIQIWKNLSGLLAKRLMTKPNF